MLVYSGKVQISRQANRYAERCRQQSREPDRAERTGSTWFKYMFSFILCRQVI
jgi:hypothetical protein